jgi:V-type H+-transporting ATPase subunit a
MKLSVIFGVAQMLFGTCLSFFNHTYYRKGINIFCEFVPQVIFLLSIFGYMNCMIIMKWFIFDSESTQKAPSVLISLINMFMFKYDETGPENLRSMYDGQPMLQKVLVFMALICVPWMLLIKPTIMWKRNKRQKMLDSMYGTRNEVSRPSNASTAGNGTVLTEASGNHKNSIEDGEVPSSEGDHGEHGSGDFDFGDIMIHQAIHTIEYCLGSISHTASYLRLWALSLAHAQLSEVLWNMVMQIGLSKFNGFVGGLVMFFVFIFWSILTIAVLLLMEGLSAFLHALRLHWVEFQSKFYLGSGVIFEPFSFKVILANAETLEES